MTACAHCGRAVEPQDVHMDGSVSRWRHAGSPGTEHCIVSGRLGETVAEPADA